LFDGYQYTLGPEVRRRMDLAIFDVRGTGRSRAVDCVALQRTRPVRSTDAADACQKRTLGSRRSLYTTRQSVADLLAVLDHLGVRRAILYGTSYGTKLAVAFAQAHPDRVRRLLLDSVVPPDGPSTLDLQTFRALPSVLTDLCHNRCRGVTTDLGRELRGLVERLRRNQLTGTVYGRTGDA
jgi:pimeloyl-ACP methyl ester carboxylesterase